MCVDNHRLMYLYMSLPARCSSKTVETASESDSRKRSLSCRYNRGHSALVDILPLLKECWSSLDRVQTTHFDSFRGTSGECDLFPDTSYANKEVLKSTLIHGQPLFGQLEFIILLLGGDPRDVPSNKRPLRVHSIYNNRSCLFPTSSRRQEKEKISNILIKNFHQERTK